MAYTGLWQDNLPWSDSENDRKVVGYIFISLFVCSILYTIVMFLPLQQVKEQKLEVVAPRLAKLIIEHQKKLHPPPPPPLPKVKKKATPKPVPKKAEKPKPRARAKKVAPRKTVRPRPNRAALAHQQAQRHITEIQDALADLRQMNVASSIKHTRPLRSHGDYGHAANNHDNATAIIASQAGKGSGGIDTHRLSRATGSSHLRGRRTTAVTSALATEEARGGGGGSNTGGGGRSRTRSIADIVLVFQKYKQPLYNLYQRALRRDPTLQGKVVLELTITPAGHVTKVRIVSSEIKDPQLLEQLKMRVKLIRFPAKNVDTLIVKYPIDFLPTT